MICLAVLSYFFLMLPLLSTNYSLFKSIFVPSSNFVVVVVGLQTVFLCCSYFFRLSCWRSTEHVDCIPCRRVRVRCDVLSMTQTATDGEAPAVVIWEMRNTLSLLLTLVLLWSREIVPIRVPCKGQIEFFNSVIRKKNNKVHKNN